MMCINLYHLKRGICSRFLFLVLTTLSVVSCKKENNTEAPLVSNSQNNSEFTEDLRSYYLQNLDSLETYLKLLDPSKSVSENKRIFKEVRKWYKYAEPFMIAFDNNNYLTINGPNLLIVHAEDYTEIKKIKPKSLQVVEELLYNEEGLNKEELELQLIFLRSRVPFMLITILFTNKKTSIILR
ncbi:hypothetical protein [Jejuia pallidilutea]|uniref:Uncharacterized protein n=1 Tax=Jejuia pallidilutea TaxID=504487 RepID=A0A090VYQ7_9FLAO|nr:hypothetical protein [Jejuia pallidilutea]GAL69826.1 hypothetical protein JCM19302_721 [Jejuia pallidilutea]